MAQVLTVQSSLKLGSRKGSSLAGVVVGAGVLGILAVGMASFLNNSQKGASSVNNRVAMSKLQTWVQLFGQQGDRCGAGFHGPSGNLQFTVDQFVNAKLPATPGAPGTSIEIQKLQIGGEGIEKNKAFDDVIVERISLAPMWPAATAAEFVPGPQAVMLEVQTKPKGDSFGPKVFVDRIPMNLFVDGDVPGVTAPGIKVKSCDSSDDSMPPKEICEALGLSYNEADKTCGKLGQAQSCAAGEMATGVDGQGAIICVPAPSPTPVATPVSRKKYYKYYTPWWRAYKNDGSKETCMNTNNCQYAGGETSITGQSGSDICGVDGIQRPIAIPPAAKVCPPGSYTEVKVCGAGPPRNDPDPKSKGVVKTPNANKISTWEFAQVTKVFRICIED